MAVELTELESMRAAIDPDCTRVHLLIVHDDEDVQMLQYSSQDDYSNHDIRIERVAGGAGGKNPL